MEQWVVNLDNMHPVGMSSLTALNNMLTSVLEKYLPTVKLDDDQKQGKDISASLSTMKLDLPAFNYLVA